MQRSRFSQDTDQFRDNQRRKDDGQQACLPVLVLDLFPGMTDFLDCVDERDVYSRIGQIELGKNRAGQSFRCNTGTIGYNKNSTCRDILLCRHISACRKE